MIEKKHLEELQRIINSINGGGDETQSFSTYLEQLCSVTDQSYSSTAWPENWRKMVYKFGRLFLEKDAGPYLKVVNKFLADEKPCEIAAFFSSEILWNYYEETSEFYKTALKGYIELFPHNPEFHNNYGIFLAAKLNFPKSLDEHKTAIRLDDSNGAFINNYTLAVKQYFEYLLKKKDILRAEPLIKEALEFIESTELKGIAKWEQVGRLNSLRDRLNDFQIVLESVGHFKNEIEVKIRGEQKRLIEVLGIFSAILAFILTNIAIALTSLNATEVLVLMFGMALVLIIFAVSISLLFSPKKRHANFFSFLEDNRFWTITILSSVLLVWIYFNGFVSHQNNQKTIGAGEMSEFANQIHSTSTDENIITPVTDDIK